MREEVERLQIENETLQTGYREKLSEWNIERLRLQAQLNKLRQSQGPHRKDLEALRDRILKSLKLGTQAPGYKAARKALDQFIKEIKHE